jgi:hypothetical protein
MYTLGEKCISFYDCRFCDNESPFNCSKQGINGEETYFKDCNIKIVVTEKCYICGSYPGKPTKLKDFCSRCGNRP